MTLIADIETELRDARLARDDARRDALSPAPERPPLRGEGAPAHR